MRDRQKVLRMTSHRLRPIVAKQHGMDFAELSWRILETRFKAVAHAGRGTVELREVAHGA